MLQVGIIEVGEKSNKVLNNLLSNRFPDVSVANVLPQVNVEATQVLPPPIDLVFLDISNQTDRIDFTFLDSLIENGTEIIVISSNNSIPIEIHNLNPLYFLEKPISLQSIQRGILKYSNKVSKKEMLIDSDRLSVPVRDGWEIIDVKKVVYVKADSNYSDIVLEDGSKRKSSKPLKHFARCLETKNFIRIHQSYLVNSMFMKKLSKDKSPSLILSNGTVLPVSRSGKQELRRLFVN